MLELVKTALRITTTAYDTELNFLISAALDDLERGGVMPEVLVITTETDLAPLVKRAVITYCKMNFGLPEDYDKLKASYDEQKAQLGTATGFTDWRL
jgi:hypothetical protein